MPMVLFHLGVYILFEMMLLWKGEWEGGKAFPLQWKNGQVMPTVRAKLKDWKRLAAHDDIHREGRLHM